MIEEVSKSPSWIDPTISDNPLHAVLTWTVLAIPTILFLGSIFMLVSIWSWMPIAADRFPAFAAATEFNKLIYSILYFIGGIFLVFSYILIIKELRKE